MQLYPHTSNALVAVLALGAVGIVKAAPIGVTTGVVGGLGNGVGIHAGGQGSGGFAGGVHAGSGFSGSAANVGGAAAADSAVAVAPGAPDLNIDTSNFESLGMRQQRIAAQATATHAIETKVPTTTMTGEYTVTAALNRGPTAEVIGTTSADDRTSVVANLDARIRASAKALAGLKAQTKALNTEERAQFKAAMKETTAREKVVQRDLKAAAHASANAWIDSRAKLAADYEAYVHVAQRAEAIATANASRSNAAATTTGVRSGSPEAGASSSTMGTAAAATSASNALLAAGAATNSTAAVHSRL